MISLLHTIGKLKLVKRAGWKKHNILLGESVADHSYRVAMMALLLGKDTQLNMEQLLKLALVHDVAESIVGDITPDDAITTDEKMKKEEHALTQMNDTGLLALWKEYEQAQTPEAKFIKQLDNLEMALQAYEYEEQYELHLQEFFDSSEPKITDPALQKIFAEIMVKRA